MRPGPLTGIRDTVAHAVQRGADRGWSLDSLPWGKLRPERLTETDTSVVRFITYIENHLPGYLSWLLDTFPVIDDDIGLEDCARHREYFRFFVAWAYDEERHAAALTRYQIESGLAEPTALLADLAAEGRKQIDLPYEHPLQAFTYTLVQEKATQLFYQRFNDVVQEPVLNELLRLLARDESRHFAFYNQLVSGYLRRGGAAAVPHLKDVLTTFRMPLATTLTGYWRWSLKVADAVGYDHTEAYEALARLVRELVDAPGEPAVDDLLTFVARVRRLQ
jgi:acyl-[acyl-carrier-protein] desaturase